MSQQFTRRDLKPVVFPVQLKDEGSQASNCRVKNLSLPGYQHSSAIVKFMFKPEFLTKTNV